MCTLVGLAAATEQLAVVGDSKAQSEAQMLLDACQAAYTDTWVLPLALLLEDASCLAGMGMLPLMHICRHLVAVRNYHVKETLSPCLCLRQTSAGALAA